MKFCSVPHTNLNGIRYGLLDESFGRKETTVNCFFFQIQKLFLLCSILRKKLLEDLSIAVVCPTTIATNRSQYCTLHCYAVGLLFYLFTIYSTPWWVDLRQHGPRSGGARLHGWPLQQRYHGNVQQKPSRWFWQSQWLPKEATQYHATWLPGDACAAQSG